MPNQYTPFCARCVAVSATEPPQNKATCPGEGTEWGGGIDRGVVRISTVTRLDVGASARTAVDHRTLLREPPISSMPVEHLTPNIDTERSNCNSPRCAAGPRLVAPSIERGGVVVTARTPVSAAIDGDRDSADVVHGLALAGTEVRSRRITSYREAPRGSQRVPQLLRQG